MKIKSNADSSFKIDGIVIVPGLKNYRQLDASKREVKYQLGVLKAEGVLEFNEIIEVNLNELPFVKEEKKQEPVAQIEIKVESAPVVKKKKKSKK